MESCHLENFVIIKAKIFCCPALELFSCLPLWNIVRLPGRNLQNAIKSCCQRGCEPPGISGFKKEDRKTNGQSITISTPRFENLMMALNLNNIIHVSIALLRKSLTCGILANFCAIKQQFYGQFIVYSFQKNTQKKNNNNEKASQSLFPQYF